MGLLGSLLKVGGKVLKKAASVATRGASDHVLKAVKSLGTAKSLLKPGKGTTIGMQALANRVVPAVRITPTLRDAAAGNASIGTRARGTGTRRRRKRATPRTTPRATAPRRRRRSAAVNQTTAPRRRRPPRGGLNLKAMSANWKAAGKPGTWRAWVSDPASQIRNGV